MSVALRKIEPQDWQAMAEDAHLGVFAEHWPRELERVDYALLVVDEKDQVIQYVTIRETDGESAYLQYGGSFPPYRGSVRSWQGFLAILEWLKGRYHRAAFLTENTNSPMLKFGLKAGFRIVGVRVFGGKVLLEHVREFLEKDGEAK